MGDFHKEEFTRMLFKECGENVELGGVQIRTESGLCLRTCNFRTERKINYGTISEAGVVSRIKSGLSLITISERYFRQSTRKISER